jgi:putative ABC transport system ATP-binding protein
LANRSLLILQILTIEISAKRAPVEQHASIQRIAEEEISMALVELRGVTKRFSKGDETITPLDHVDLQIEAGQFVSLMGPSGTGKSTLLNLVAGIDRPDSGQIIVAGTEITALSRGRLADWRAANLGYIFQTHNLIPVLTAYENVELPTLLLKQSASERHRRVQLALEAVGLSDRAHHYPRQLSGGQEQRVGIARAIVSHPKVVVADEPTGSLDAATSAQVQELLQRLNRELDITMLMVTHDADVAAIAKHQLVLERGKFIAADAARQPPQAVG